MERTNSELLKAEIEKLKQEQTEKLAKLDISLETQLTKAIDYYTSEDKELERVRREIVVAERKYRVESYMAEAVSKSGLSKGSQEKVFMQATKATPRKYAIRKTKSCGGSLDFRAD